jgi:hypothetical protein
MNPLTALKSMCERDKVGIRNQLCPFRSISNDYCEKYDMIEKGLKMTKVELINKIIELDSRWKDSQGKLFSKSKKDLEKLLRRKYEQETRKGSCD